MPGTTSARYQSMEGKPNSGLLYKPSSRKGLRHLSALYKPGCHHGLCLSRPSSHESEGLPGMKLNVKQTLITNKILIIVCLSQIFILKPLAPLHDCWQLLQTPHDPNASHSVLLQMRIRLLLHQILFTYDPQPSGMWAVIVGH